MKNFKNTKVFGIICMTLMSIYTSGFSQTTPHQKEAIWKTIDEENTSFIQKDLRIKDKELEAFNRFSSKKVTPVRVKFFGASEITNAFKQQIITEMHTVLRSELLPFRTSPASSAAKTNAQTAGETAPQDAQQNAQSAAIDPGTGGTVTVAGCNNVGFEDGTTNGWQTYNGTYASPNTSAGLTYSAVANGGTDPYVGFLGNENYLRLNDNEASRIAEQISQTFAVTNSNTSFSYSFAVILNDGGHPASQQPYFKIEFLDQGGTPIPCTGFNVVASNAVVGFEKNGEVLYKPWTTVAVDLRNYVGTNVTIRFTVAGCDIGGHFGYAYIKCSCIPFSIKCSSPTNTICNNDDVQLTAPAGAVSYSWIGPDPSVNGRTSQVVSTHVPGNYSVNMTSVSGSNCTYSAAITLSKVNFSVSAGPDKIGCNSVQIGETPRTDVTYSWSPITNLSNSTVGNPSVSPPVNNTAYTVTATSSTSGCTASDQVTVKSCPKIDFTYNPVCTEKKTKFTNTSTGDLTGMQFCWDYGCGVTSSEYHVFVNPGTYPVKLYDCNNPSNFALKNVVVSNCGDGPCITAFIPLPGKKYVLSAWVKESQFEGLSTYPNPAIRISFNNDPTAYTFQATGEIIDGWQRIEKEFDFPCNALDLTIDLKNLSSNATKEVYFDDIRILPFDAQMVSYVYDPVTLRLTAELDNNHYATFYDYDEEGNLVRVKKETDRGIVTVKESRTSTVKR